MVVEFFKPNQAFKGPTRTQPQKPQSHHGRNRSDCFSGWNTIARPTPGGPLRGPAMNVGRKIRARGGRMPSTGIFSCGSTACGAWEDCRGGARPTQPSGARAPWPSCADGSGFRSSMDGPPERARPVGLAIAGPSLQLHAVGKPNSPTLPRVCGCVQTL